MKLAFSTNAFKQHTLEQALSAIAAAGYAGVEVMADAPHLDPQSLTATEVARVSALLAHHGLAPSNINAFTGFVRGNTYDPSWISDDDEDRRWRIDHTRRCIDLAAAWGFRCISLQPGGPTERVPRDVAIGRFVEGLQEVLPLAAQRQVLLGVEPEPGLAIESLAEMRSLLERLSHSHLRMNCDLGHHFCVGEDPAQVLRDARDIICHVHLEDISADRVHQHLIPGDGAMDFVAIRDTLETIEYTGWVTVELYPFVVSAAQTATLARQRLASLWGTM